MKAPPRDRSTKKVKGSASFTKLGPDGMHKESLLRGLIEKHVPHDPPLLSYGGLVISSPDQAYACISVKSAFGKDELIEAAPIHRTDC